MIERILSFFFIYRSTFSDILLQSNQGLTKNSHPPVLSNLNCGCIDNVEGGSAGTKYYRNDHNCMVLKAIYKGKGWMQIYVYAKGAGAG